MSASTGKGLTRLMAATDLSELAGYAVARAFGLAASTGADLTLVHVLNGRVLEQLRLLLGGEAAPVEQRLRDSAEASIRAQMAAVGADTPAGLRLVAGEIIATLLAEADRLDAGLVVLGAAGESLARRFLLGATVERLLQKTTRPLLVVRQPASQPYRKVLVPIDFSDWSLPALHLARAVAPEARLVLLHAYEAPFEARLGLAGVDEGVIQTYRTSARLEAEQQLRELVAAAGLPAGSYVTQLKHGPAVRVIENSLAHDGCELVVMGKHGRGMVEEMLMGSVTQHLVQEAKVDVLVSSLAEV